MVAGVALDLVAEDNGFGHVFHGSAFLATLALEGEVGLLLGEAEIALQDAFGALDEFAGFKLLREVGVFALEARHFDFGADQESDGGDELYLALGVDVRLAVLDVDDADGAPTAEEGHGEESFVAVFREFVEELEAWVLGSITGDGYGFEMLGDPSSDALADMELEAVDDFGVGVLGGAEDEFFVLQHINEARIALDQCGGELDYSI